MLGTYTAPRKASAPAEEEAPDALAARHLRAIRFMVGALVVIHVGIFIMLVVLATKVAHLITYYQPYLSGPLSGSNIASTIDNAVVIVGAVRNITTVAAAAAAAGASSMGFAAPPAFQPPSPEGRRALLADSPSTTAPSEGTSVAQVALAKLFDAVTRKVDEVDLTAPARFLTWIMQQQPGPYIREVLTLVRYGEATLGTLFGALGASVNPALVGNVV